jgi:hypothetical protein
MASTLMHAPAAGAGAIPTRKVTLGDVTLGVEPDGTIGVPNVLVPQFLALGFVPAPGTVMPGDVATELPVSFPSEHKLYLQTNGIHLGRHATADQLKAAALAHYAKTSGAKS